MAENPFAAPAEVAAPATGLISAEQQRAVAEVQAQLLIARANRRDPRLAMDEILQECTRLSLAETALYEFARGGTEISGPSIRLMETIARHWGNLASGVKEISRRDGYSECVAYAWDLETNYRDEKQYQVRHQRDTRRGAQRITDERDLYELIMNSGQRRKRAALQAVIPGDVVEAAVQQCTETLHAQADTSPEALKKLVEAFAGLGVTREQIEARCQRRLESIRPAQIVQLRKIWSSLKDEMSQVSDWFEAPTPAQPQPQGGTEGLRSRLQQRTTAPRQDARNAPPAPEVVPDETPAPTPAAEDPTPQDPGDDPSDRPREESPDFPTPPGDVPVIVIKPKRVPRGGWNWTVYAEDIIDAAQLLPVARLQEFRNANAQMLNVLRESAHDEWDRVQMELADYERQGDSPVE